MATMIANIAKSFLNIVYPLRCASCSTALDFRNEWGVCKPCLARVRPCPEPVKNAQTANFDRASIAYLFDGPLKEIVHSFKYKNRVSLGRILSKLLIDFLADNASVMDGVDIITFVPLRKKRLRQREFNQSKILALAISKRFAVPVMDTLEKTKDTGFQSELKRDERLANLKGAFRIRTSTRVEGLTALLVDDVMTTGSTLNECAGALKDAGARQVRALALAGRAMT